MTTREFRKLCNPKQFIIIEFEKNGKVISLDKNYGGNYIYAEDLVIMWKSELLDSEIKSISSRYLECGDSAIVLFVDYKEVK